MELLLPKANPETGLTSADGVVVAAVVSDCVLINDGNAEVVGTAAAAVVVVGAEVAVTVAVVVGVAVDAPKLGIDDEPPKLIVPPSPPVLEPRFKEAGKVADVVGFVKLDKEFVVDD